MHGYTVSVYARKSIYSIKAISYQGYVLHTTHAKDMPLINIHVQTIRHAFMHACGIMLCMGVLFKFGKIQLYIY